MSSLTPLSEPCAPKTLNSTPGAVRGTGDDRAVDLGALDDARVVEAGRRDPIADRCPPAGSSPWNWPPVNHASRYCDGEIGRRAGPGDAADDQQDAALLEHGQAVVAADHGPPIGRVDDVTRPRRSRRRPG